jgi:hypothetical protein
MEIQEIQNQRSALEARINELNQARQSYIRDLAKAEGEGDTFDSQVFDSLREQGALKDINLSGEMVY